MKKYIILPIVFVGCAVSPNPVDENIEYQVHLRNGSGHHHLYTGENEQDALQYIKFYQRSHGDMKLVKFRYNK